MLRDGTFYEGKRVITYANILKHEVFPLAEILSNGVVLVDYINRLRRRGMAMTEAVLTGAEHRLRPVLITATTTIGGLVPLMLANDIGSNVQRPLATVVVGGLITSTILTLVVLPAMYSWLGGEVEDVEV
ncbi:MAG: efflux RND transporter permease subunit [Myxococcota bacterium]